MHYKLAYSLQIWAETIKRGLKFNNFHNNHVQKIILKCKLKDGSRFMPEIILKLFKIYKHILKFIIYRF